MQNEWVSGRPRLKGFISRCQYHDVETQDAGMLRPSEVEREVWKKHSYDWIDLVNSTCLVSSLSTSITALYALGWECREEPQHEE